jgi:hypothetical protein
MLNCNAEPDIGPFIAEPIAKQFDWAMEFHRPIAAFFHLLADRERSCFSRRSDRAERRGDLVSPSPTGC